jgi:hypothetical protein
MKLIGKRRAPTFDHPEDGYDIRRPGSISKMFRPQEYVFLKNLENEEPNIRTQE